MKNIMIVDDDLNIRTSLARELRFYNYNIIPAETGVMALNKLDKQSVDLVIVDIRMPVMGGVKFVEEVVKEYPEIQIIILSGSVTRDIIAAIQPYRKNILDIMAKPWDEGTLVSLIESL